MYLNNQYEQISLTQSNDCTFLELGKPPLSQTAPLLSEHLMEVYINEILTMKLICTPQYLAELVLGRLLTAGIIHSMQEIESLYICETGNRAKLVVKHQNSISSRRFTETTPTCCTGNRILNDYFVHSGAMLPVQPIPWEASWISRLSDQFKKDTPLHRETFATHSCYLAMEDRILFHCEDIGRHNAMDKVIGYALRQGINLTHCIVYTSGRIPVDMAEKAVRAGIPILAGKTAVTAEAVRTAREYGLTLIGMARGNTMTLYSGYAPRDN